MPLRFYCLSVFAVLSRGKTLRPFRYADGVFADFFRYFAIIGRETTAFASRIMSANGSSFAPLKKSVRL